METLDEQLAKLTIMMERDLEPKPGMGPKKKVGPNPPPKPKKPQPQVYFYFFLFFSLKSIKFFFSFKSFTVNPHQKIKKILTKKKLKKKF